LREFRNCGGQRERNLPAWGAAVEGEEKITSTKKKDGLHPQTHRRKRGKRRGTVPQKRKKKKEGKKGSFEEWQNLAKSTSWRGTAFDPGMVIKHS